jgi:hypothetical protein
LLVDEVVDVIPLVDVSLKGDDEAPPNVDIEGILLFLGCLMLLS